METTNVRLVDRTFDVLEALSLHPNGTSIAALTAETGIHKSTIYRLLHTLISRGYVTKDEENSRYRMTLRAYQIGSRAVPTFDLLSLSLDYLKELCRTSHEAVHLAVPDGPTIVYLFKEVASENVIRIASQTGARNYMYYTGLGKALMATMPEDKVKEIWNQSEIIQYTPSTITNFSDLLADLAEIKKRGYAIDNEEHEAGIVCIADVIRNADDEAVASLSISTLANRVDNAFLEKNVPQLKKTARAISSLLGNIEASSENRAGAL